MPAAAVSPGIPEPVFWIQRRRHLVQLIEAAMRRRIVLVCAPAGAGKTVACSAWAAAARTRHIVWVTLHQHDDQAWLWASVYAGLRQAGAAPASALHVLEDEPASEFPLRLAEIAHQFTRQVVLVLDNAHRASEEPVLRGIDQLIRHAPDSLRFLLAGRRPPGLQLARLRAAGQLADVGAVQLGWDEGAGSAGAPWLPGRAPRRRQPGRAGRPASQQSPAADDAPGDEPRHPAGLPTSETAQRGD
ncbi:MAG TPA: AAA family ATPase [Streptosporangiaceae bacterium]